MGDLSERRSALPTRKWHETTRKEKDEVYAIQGTVFEVYREMGNA